MTEPTTFRVTRGEPTDAELAAVVAVLSAAASASPPAAAESPRSGWVLRSRNLRPTPPRGLDAWRMSGLPR